MKVQNKVIVVTGGGSGIGRELVLNLLSKGASAAAVDINESALQETRELAGNRKNNLSTHIVDITDRDSVAELPEQVISVLRHCTLLPSIHRPLLGQHARQRGPGETDRLRQSLQAAGAVKQIGQRIASQVTEQLDPYKRGSARVALQPGIRACPKTISHIDN